MTHLIKLHKQSPLKWVPQFFSQTLTSRSLCSKEASFINCPHQNSSKARTFPSKSQIFRTFSVRASHISSKDRILVSNCLKLESTTNRVPCISSNYGVSLIKISTSSNFRGFGTESVATEDPKPATRGPRVIHEAQNAVMDYLHITSGLDFYDAEHMAKNSLIYLDKVLNKVEKDAEDIRRAVARFLRYHPPNEFELLFESMGLRPSEFNRFLPRDLNFIKDDEKLLDNYHVLCNYGIDRGKLGKIYKEATDVFKYESGVLGMRLRAYEELGFSKTSVMKIVSSSPLLLIGDVNREFVKVLEELEDVGIQREWVAGALSVKNFYNWGRMQIVLQHCLEIGFTKKELGTLIRKHPDFVLDGSGRIFLSLIGFLMKVGATRKDIFDLLKQLPKVQVVKFMKNLHQGLLFLVETELDPKSIGMILRAHAEFIGVHTLKKARSVVSLLHTSMKRLRAILKDDPNQIKNYVKGSKLAPLPSTRDQDTETIHKRKIEFLMSLGFVENSKEMQKAVKDFRGRGDELQERCDLLIKFGVDPTDVYTMIKRAPNVLNQTVDVLEMKINFLLKDLGFPLSTLVTFPKYLAYTVERVKLRYLMYNWIKDIKGSDAPELALITILSCSHEIFRKRIICRHPKGPKMWEKFKANVPSK